MYVLDLRYLILLRIQSYIARTLTYSKLHSSRHFHNSVISLTFHGHPNKVALCGERFKDVCKNLFVACRIESKIRMIFGVYPKPNEKARGWDSFLSGVAVIAILFLWLLSFTLLFVSSFFLVLCCSDVLVLIS